MRIGAARRTRPQREDGGRDVSAKIERRSQYYCTAQSELFLAPTIVLVDLVNHFVSLFELIAILASNIRIGSRYEPILNSKVSRPILRTAPDATRAAKGLFLKLPGARHAA